ncbi:hypothetical protein ACFVFH_23795 [Streptomyces sp. NPDC057697]|uniref:hypothetical protein n=1 Tax=Streptomyces sp. NPDC057697 TaxID=3346219 RepID=UPI00367E1075
MGVSSASHRRTRTSEMGEAAVDRRRTRTPGTFRLFVLCAVLSGLFLMHGAPASAAEGCHDAMAVTASASVPPTTTAGHSAAPGGHGPALAAGARSEADGGSCVFTQARDRVLPLPAAPGPALPAVRELAGHRSAVHGPERRGPPFAGRDLLLQVGVART